MLYEQSKLLHHCHSYEFHHPIKFIKPCPIGHAVLLVNENDVVSLHIGTNSSPWTSRLPEPCKDCYWSADGMELLAADHN